MASANTKQESWELDMVVAFWSLKGGAGCSIVAALYALHRANKGTTTSLVDLSGDLPAILGVDQAGALGIGEWLTQGAAGPPDALGRLREQLTPQLGLISKGQEPLPTDEPDEVMAAQLDALPGTVVVDCGLLWPTRVDSLTAQWFAARSTTSILVTRPCYLALRRSSQAPIRPSGVVLVAEPGRALGAADVEAAVGAPVLCTISVDPAIARAVDAGLLLSRLPRGVGAALETVA